MSKKQSWNTSSKWYNNIVSRDGHSYHQDIIFPKIKERYAFKNQDTILELGCGQGVFARQIPPKITYVGVDIAPSLIKYAKRYSSHTFITADAIQPLQLESNTFTHVFMILSLQNMNNGCEAIKNSAKHLKKQGTLTLILNHPCYRIPRQSTWDIDTHQNIQYRRVNRYSTPLEIPIHTHPSKGEHSPITYSYHNSLSTFFSWLSQEEFVVSHLEEWYSQKQSTGKHAKIENRARAEFPLFLAIEATLQ